MGEPYTVAYSETPIATVLWRLKAERGSGEDLFSSSKFSSKTSVVMHMGVLHIICASTNVAVWLIES